MMTMQRLLNRVHILGTGWFLFCGSVLLIISLRQAGVNWWLIFSISGYSAVLFVFLLAFYLFALFRGVVRAQCMKEHPLSTSPAYLVFYDSAPFLGAIAGVLGSYGIADWSAVMRIVAEGTLGMTFVTWVVLDSVVGMVESTLPQSICHRSRRLAEARAEKRRIQQDNDLVLKALEQREESLHRDWEMAFRTIAVELAGLYCIDDHETEQLQLRTIDAGAKAWQMGKLSCMRFVHRMILEEMERRPEGWHIDYATLWWDGIGSWRRPRESVLSPVQ
jgi:hypothetical protein